MRITSGTVYPDFALIGSPADSVQQFDGAGRLLRNSGGDDPVCLEIGDLHSPKVSDIVHDIVAGAVDRIRSEDSRIRSDPRHRIAARIDQIEVCAAAVLG